MNHKEVELVIRKLMESGDNESAETVTRLFKKFIDTCVEINDIRSDFYNLSVYVDRLEEELYGEENYGWSYD